MSLLDFRGGPAERRLCFVELVMRFFGGLCSFFSEREGRGRLFLIAERALAVLGITFGLLRSYLFFFSFSAKDDEISLCHYGVMQKIAVI